jgi:peptidoglycan/LPS O-acetylase OafA/YrhL
METRTLPHYRPFGAFRFTLSMLVALQHGLVLLGQSGRETLYDLELGAVAVAVFFALSGFIVAEALGSFYRNRPAAFLLNRALRLVPPYLAALALAIAADALLSGAQTLQPLAGTLQGSPLRPRIVAAAILEIVPGLPAWRISGTDFSFIPYAWTLRVESAFYLVAAALVLILPQLHRDRPAPGDGGIVRPPLLLGLICLGCLAWAAHRLSARPGSSPTQLVNVPFFGFGVIAHGYAKRLDAKAAPVFAVFALLCLAAFPMWGQRGHPVLMFQMPLLLALLGLLVRLSRTALTQAPLLAWDRALGALSYPIYLTHGVVLTVLSSLWPQRGAWPYLAALAPELALAALLFGLVETPLRPLRNRLRGVPL